jgi:serine/threonine protein phosphatase PrpC
MSQQHTPILRSTLTAHSVAGPKQQNEDRGCARINSSHRVQALAVFDGHGGAGGALAAQTAKETCERFLVANDRECDAWNGSQWKQQILQLFATMHSNIRAALVASAPAGERYAVDGQGVVRRADGKPVHGGTTATIVVSSRHADGRRFLVHANVGDSEAYLVAGDGKHMLPLTANHKPTNPAEFRRVTALRSPLRFVYDKQGVDPEIFQANGEKDERYVRDPWGNGLKPCNVRYEPGSYVSFTDAARGDFVRLAMTRSLGDFYAHPLGVSAEPSINVVELADDVQDAAVCVASDGVWDVWQYEAFAAHVAELKAANALSAERIMVKSMKQAYDNFGRNAYDDSTLVVLQLPNRVHAPAHPQQPAVVAPAAAAPVGGFGYVPPAAAAAPVGGFGYMGPGTPQSSTPQAGKHYEF